MWHFAGFEPRDQRRIGVAPQGSRRRRDEATFLRLLPEAPRALGDGRGDVVDAGPPVLADEGIEVDEPPDPLRHAVRRAGDHHAAIAVPEKNHLIEVFYL